MGQVPEEQRYIRILGMVEQACVRHNLDHRFLGGSFTDFLGLQTKLISNSTTRTIFLEQPNSISMDDSKKYIKDIDLLTFTNDEKAVLQAREEFEQWAQEAKRDNLPFPRIEIKPVRHPGWPTQGIIKEFANSFLSNLYVDNSGRLIVKYCDVEQEIPWDTIQGWRVRLDAETEITTFHPYAHALTYGLFIPGEARKKDRQVRIDSITGKQYSKNSLLFRFAQESIEQGRKDGVNYDEIYKSWFEFIRRVKEEGNWLTQLKLETVRAYWETIGTQLSHGKGLPSRIKDKMHNSLLSP